MNFSSAQDRCQAAQAMVQPIHEGLETYDYGSGRSYVMDRPQSRDLHELACNPWINVVDTSDRDFGDIIDDFIRRSVSSLGEQLKTRFEATGRKVIHGTGPTILPADHFQNQEDPESGEVTRDLCLGYVVYIQVDAEVDGR